MLLSIPNVLVTSSVSQLVPSEPSLGDFSVLLNSLSYISFTLHLLLVNIVVGLSCVFFLRYLSSGAESVDDSHGGSVLSYLPKILAFTVNVGIVPLLFAQLIFYSYIYTASVLTAVFWLSLIFTIIVAYYGLYIASSTSLSSGLRLPALLCSIVFFLITAFFFTNLNTIAQSPASWLAYADDARGTILNFADPQLIPRYLHIVVGCLAFGGLSSAILAKCKITKLSKHLAPLALIQKQEGYIQTGLRYFLLASCLQLVVGTWFFLSLPEHIIWSFLGGNLFLTLVFAVAVVFVISSLYLAYKQNVRGAAISAVILLFCMTGLRALVRNIYLEGLPSVNYVDGPFLPRNIFLLAIVALALCIVYMWRLYSKRNPQGQALFAQEIPTPAEQTHSTEQ